MTIIGDIKDICEQCKTCLFYVNNCTQDAVMFWQDKDGNLTCSGYSLKKNKK